MRKIEYPNADKEIKKFHKAYLNSLSSVAITAINTELKKFPKYIGKKLTFQRLVTMNFNDLYLLSNQLQTFVSSYNKTVFVTGKRKKTKVINSFNDFFNYKEQQPSIARFFMHEMNLKIKTCFYCGIDYINSFTDIGDYKDAIDFLNRASFEELQFIDGIGEVTANKIIALRRKNKIRKAEEITSSSKILGLLKSFDFKCSHNHFTLDHVLPQSKFPYLSLCLYNLVPSCYSCNAKFKKAIDFELNEHLLRISPTSKDYRLTDDFNFKILFSDKLQDIKSVKDFNLYRKVKRNEKQIEKYASIFKLDGRYTFHKDELLELIHNKIKYSKKKIESMSFDLGVSRREILELIYGKELFKDQSNTALHKLKRDVALDIKIVDL